MTGAFAKWLIGAGIFLIVTGVVLLTMQKLPWLGKLPGDVFVRKGNFSFYMPLGTCILLSVIATIVLNFLGRK